MTSSPELPRDPGGVRPAPATAARAPTAFWRAAERVARVCTAGELATLADHHQVGQPVLAARFRAAARAPDGHRA